MLPNNHPPIVFIHGLWLHGESWHKWLDFFRYFRLLRLHLTPIQR
jgi:pimeloyl-ACP methyl ester carboxylesterase